MLMSHQEPIRADTSVLEKQNMVENMHVANRQWQRELPVMRDTAPIPDATSFYERPNTVQENAAADIKYRRELPVIRHQPEILGATSVLERPNTVEENAADVQWNRELPITTTALGPFAGGIPQVIHRELKVKSHEEEIPTAVFERPNTVEENAAGVQRRRELPITTTALGPFMAKIPQVSNRELKKHDIENRITDAVENVQMMQENLKRELHSVLLDLFPHPVSDNAVHPTTEVFHRMSRDQRELLAYLADYPVKNTLELHEGILKAKRELLERHAGAPLENRLKLHDGMSNHQRELIENHGGAVGNDLTRQWWPAPADERELLANHSAPLL